MTAAICRLTRRRTLVSLQNARARLDYKAVTDAFGSIVYIRADIASYSFFKEPATFRALQQ
jgi:hypothetical protein